MTCKRRNGSRICDEEVLLNIFSRLPTRDAVRCAALSRHHRRVIGSLEFWLLHRRLDPPTPRPHIAYMASSEVPGGLFHEFHLAGYGGDECPGGNNGQIRRALIDRERPHSRRRKYVGTCNGLVLLADVDFYTSTTVVLVNPAVAGSEQEVRIDLSYRCGPGCYRVSGFGYGASSRCHKVLVTRVNQKPRHMGAILYNDAELLVYTLEHGCTDPNDEDDDEQWCRTVVSSTSWPPKMSGSSVYLDGKIYLLADHSRVLAFDVDGEAVATIDLPGERAPGEDEDEKHAKSKLMEMSGRLCVATASGEGSIALWLLTADQQWERRCQLSRSAAANKLAGAWERGGVLLLLFKSSAEAKENDGLIVLYDTRTNKASEPLHVPQVVVPEPKNWGSRRRHAVCWGYQPTLVSPGSIVAGGAPPPPQQGGGAVTALNPVLELDVDTGRKQTLETVCLMDMLLYIMRQLPDKANDIVREFSRGSLPFSLG